jgi:probable phosphoglycerate mutase
MTTQLIIIRHGNTFLPDETPVRVGARTDLDLVPSGQKQGRQLGEFFKTTGITPAVFYSAELKRSYQTAEIARDELDKNIPIETTNIFDEIDYGPDEAKTEEEVYARIGKQAVEKWNESAIVPDGWKVNPDEIIKNWTEFTDMIAEKYPNQTVAVVTSNGIARFAPHLTGDFDGFAANNKIKIKTGAMCFLHQEDNHWAIDIWNLRPKDYFKNPEGYDLTQVKNQAA